MYDILDDGRVALDPTSPNDRIALSVYADLLRQDQDKLDEMSGNEPSLNDLERVLRKPLRPNEYHLVNDGEGYPDIKSLLRFIEDNVEAGEMELTKVVVRTLTPTKYVVESESEANMEKGVKL